MRYFYFTDFNKYRVAQNTRSRHAQNTNRAKRIKRRENAIVRRNDDDDENAPRLYRNAAGPVLTAVLVIVDAAAAAAASRDTSTVPSARALAPSAAAAKTCTVAPLAERVFRYGKFNPRRRHRASSALLDDELPRRPARQPYPMTYYYIVRVQLPA